MNDENRPSPDDLLKAIHEEELESKRGKLKIFLGMAAGVGKTYAMLQEAQGLRLEGTDLVIGTINTHGREETAKLINGIEAIPEKVVSYRDKEFHELDTEAIIARRPSLVLVDELAHENIPGSNHPKRWQDVMQILEAGIDVYTTLNVQHIESLNDIVREITEISVRETVPDHVIEKAASIRMIDLTPDELLERLDEGKVYIGDQSKIAILHFFQKDRLAALRELVFRYAADKIDRDLKKITPLKGSTIDWRPHEKFLVAVGNSPHSQKIIRLTRRLATAIDAPWIALHVDQGETQTEKEQEQLSRNLALAQNLGAEVMTIHDPDVVEGIKRIAAQRSVTQIILGRSPSGNSFIFFQKSRLFQRLARECNDMDIHVVKVEKYRTTLREIASPFFVKRNYRRTLLFILFLFLILGTASLAIPWIGYGEGFLFLGLLIISGLTIAIFADRAKRQKESLLKSEKKTMILYEIARNFSENSSIPKMTVAIQDLLQKYLEGLYHFKIVDHNGTFNVDFTEPLLTGQKEKNTAIWAFEHGEEAGWSTETLPDSKNLYIPLMGIHKVMGLLIYHPTHNIPISLEERTFLYTVCQQVGSYLERYLIMEREKERAALEQIEKMHKTVLDRFTSAFEAPVQETKRALAEAKKQAAIPALDQVESAFDIFVTVLNNISSMAQLSEGMIPLKKTLADIGEVIEECCKNASRFAKDHLFRFEKTKDTPLLRFDYYLIQILLHNLILNAIEHSPSGSTVTIEAGTAKEYLFVTVTNEGSKIPEDQLEAIFEKYYRLPEEKSTNIGIGLTISRTIAELHQGRLIAENLPVKGTRFSLFLPL